LTHKGCYQAEKLGKDWANIRIDALYSSDMNRARDTAVSISRHNRCHPVLQLTKSLQEKDHGIAYSRLKEEGRFSEAVQARRGGRKGSVPRNFRPEGGESYDDVLDRGISTLIFWRSQRTTSRYAPCGLAQSQPILVPAISSAIRMER